MIRTTVVAFIASLALAANAIADPIYGGIDTVETSFDKLDCAALNLNLADCEEAALAAKLNLDVDDINLTKIDTTASDWIQVSDTLVAFDFLKYNLIDPLFYIVKIGNAVNDFYLFSNTDSLQYALIDLSTIAAKNGSTVSITSLSHIATVPEPATFLLLTIGLGFVALRKRQQLG